MLGMKKFTYSSGNKEGKLYAKSELADVDEGKGDKYL